MNNPQIRTDPFQLKLNFPPNIQFSDDQFFEFCRMNRELSIEKNDKGDILIMSPTGGESGYRNSYLITELMIWSRNDTNGVVFDSSTGFILPNGAIRSPDASSVKRSRLETLTPEQKSRFLPLCPDVVIELCSPSDRISDLQNKMKEYMDNGALLGWLIDPNDRNVYIYRSGREVECLVNPARIFGDDVLPGFVLELEEIWIPRF